MFKVNKYTRIKSLHKVLRCYYFLFCIDICAVVINPFATLLKKRLWHRCFPVIFANFLRIPLWQNTSERRLLKITELHITEEILLIDHAKQTKLTDRT